MSDRDPRSNALLSALPDDEFENLRRHLEVVESDLRTYVYRTGDPIAYLYFPLDAIYSMVTELENGLGIEVVTVGYEGVVGLPAFLGVTSSPLTVFCQIAGSAARLPAASLSRVLVGDGTLHRQLSHYTQATMVQMAQNVACNSTHSAEQRACRWLLMTQDRVARDEFTLTQEFLAQMLALRRPTVSDVARSLQDQGLVRYTRGRMTILDRAALEERACECYGIIRSAYPHLDADAPGRRRW